MSISLIIALTIFALVLIITTTIILQKGLIPVKYSLLWYFIAAVILLVAIFSPPLEAFAHLVGFQTLANFTIGILIALLTFLTLALTIIVSKQRRQITHLTQELSLLKSRLDILKIPKTPQTAQITTSSKTAQTTAPAKTTTTTQTPTTPKTPAQLKPKKVQS